MNHDKEQSKESEFATDNQKADEQGKENLQEQDPGRGYYRSIDLRGEQLKYSIIRHRWEH